MRNVKKETGKKQHGSSFEHSAGGVIFRKKGDKVEILLLKDKNKNWCFPKGLIEENEELVKTAEREVEEEVGLANLVYINTLDSIGYFYRFKTRLIQKKVDFFLFRYDGNETPMPQAEEGITDVQWFSPSRAFEIIGYAKTKKPILTKALEILKTKS